MAKRNASLSLSILEEIRLKSPNQITRRSFLNTSALAAGSISLAGFASGLVGCAPTSGSDKKDDNPELASSGTPVRDELHPYVCRGTCNGVCSLNAHVRDGKIVRVSPRDYPDTSFNRCCPCGLATPSRVYSDHRLKYPMKRVGERGSGKWEQITWEEAIKLITDKWKECLASGDPNSVGYAWRTGQNGALFAVVYERLKSFFGGSGWYFMVDNAAFSDDVITGIPASQTCDQWVNSRTILSLGNVAEAAPHWWQWMRKAQQNGARIIVLNPEYAGIAVHADKWIPIRPGTDSAFFMGAVHCLIDNNWLDWDYLKTQTALGALVRKDTGKYLRLVDLTGEAPADGEKSPAIVMDNATGAWGILGETEDYPFEGTFTVEGIECTTSWSLLLERLKEFPIDRCVEICGVSQEDMEYVADSFANHGPAAIDMGMGIDHRSYASLASIATGTFFNLTPNRNIPGASYSARARLTGFSNIGSTLPEGLEPLAPITRYSPFKLADVLESGSYGDEKVSLKMLIVYGNDIVHSLPNRQRVIKALDNLEMLVSINKTLNDTTQYADIILPVCEWCETEEIIGLLTYSSFMSYSEKVIEPQFESKSDFEIVKLLFEGMGHPEAFPWETPEDVLRETFGDDVYERLRSEGSIWIPQLEEQGKTSYDTTYDTYLTETGKVQVYREDGTHYTDQGRTGSGASVGYGLVVEDPDVYHMMNWLPPMEGWNTDVKGAKKNPLADKYPLCFKMCHPRLHVETHFATVPALRELDPEPIVRMNPQDAQARGISEGDYVRMFNDRGEVVLKAIMQAGLMPGNVECPNGFVRGQFKSGHSSDLFSTVQDPFYENSCHNDTLVEIELEG